MSRAAKHPADLRPSFEALLARAHALVDLAHATGIRRVLGIAGAPGAGKSTLAVGIADALGVHAAYLPMDGYHLAQAELVRMGRADRKGAPDTFDAAGFVALLRRLRAGDGDTVYAPRFERAIEEPIAGAIAIASDVPLVVAEGNYLLLDTHPWAGIRPLLDEAWFVAPDAEARVRRLIERHVRFGRTPEDARAWVLRSDEANARLIEATAGRADLVIRDATAT